VLCGVVEVVWCCVLLRLCGVVLCVAEVVWSEVVWC